MQNTAVLVPLLRAIHGGNPSVLGEDFCGTAALSRSWVRTIPGSRAIAIDIDPAPLAVARKHRAKAGRSLVLKRCNALAAPLGPAHRADVIFVGNFSIGELHDRGALVEYLCRCRARLRPGGVFIADTYGGESAFRLGAVQRTHPGPARSPGVRIRYTWQQRAADPLTGMVENALHYRVERDGVVVQELTDAFVYRWRLWSVPELRDAMRQAGLTDTGVYATLPDAKDQHGQYFVRPIQDPAELEESFIVCVAGRRGARA